MNRAEKLQSELKKYRRQLSNALGNIQKTKRSGFYDNNPDIEAFDIENKDYLLERLNQLKDSITKHNSDSKTLTAKRLTETDKVNAMNMPGKNRQQKYIITIRLRATFKDGSKPEWLHFTFTFNKDDIFENGKLNKELIEKYTREYITEIYEIDEVSEIEIRKYEVKHIKMKDIKLGSKSLGYKFLENLNGIIDEQKNDKLCVPRYIVSTLKGQLKFKKFTMKMLFGQLKTMGIDYSKGMTVQNIEDWIKRYYPTTISLYAVDPYYNVFHKVVAEGNTRIMLTFVCNNKHIYPINDNQMQHFIAKAKRLDISADTQYKYYASKYQYIQPPPVYTLTTDTTEKDMDVDPDSEYGKLLDGKLDGQVYLVDDVLNAAKSVVKQTGYMITNMKIKNGKITSFIHPVSSYIIEQGKDYFERLKMCNKLFELYPCEDFVFKNQSFTQMSDSLFQILFGKVGLKSQYNKEQAHITDTFYTCPLIQTLFDTNEYEYGKHCKAFDISSSYQTAAMNMDCCYPIFLITDSWTKYNGEKICCGEYLVEHFKIKRFSDMPIQKQVLSYTFVNYLLEHKYITKKDILLVRKASSKVDHEYISQFMQFIAEKLPRSIWGDSSKAMGNCFIGGLGQKYSTSDKGFITNDIDTVMAMRFLYPENFSMVELNDIYFIRNSMKTRMMQDNGPIYRQILCQGMKQLLDLMELTVGPDSTVIGYNTDAVFVENPLDINLNDYPMYKSEEWKPKKYFEFELRDDPVEITELKDWIVISPDGDLTNVSFCCAGRGGTGKTRLAKKNYIKGETLILAATNKVCQNIIEALGPDANVKTLDSEFWNQEDSSTALTTMKRIIVDEFSQLNLSWLKKLIQLKETGIIIQLYGDPNQCKPIQKINRYVEYMNKKVFRELCDNNIIQLKFVEGKCRGDWELNKVLNEFEETQILPEYLNYKTIDPDCDIGICKTNACRLKKIEITNDKQTDIDKVGKYYYPGLKVISNINDRIVFNSRFYYIHSFCDNKIAISDTIDGEPKTYKSGEVKYYNLKSKNRNNEIVNTFDPYYVCTVYRYQGSTISTKYNIYESNIMTFNEMNTALGRSVNLTNVCFNYTKRKYPKPIEPKHATLVNNKAINKGYIYCMSNAKLDANYIGKTTQSIEERFQQHKDDPTDNMHKYGNLEDWKCEKVIDVYYDNDEKLDQIETRYISIYYHHYKKILINERKVPKDNIKYNVINKPVIDKVVREKYHQYESNGFIVLQWSQDGKQKQIRRRTTKDKDKAMEQIQTIKQMMIDEDDGKIILSFD